MKTVRILQGAPQRRLTPEAEKLVKRYGWWYIQFQKFTYIRIAGNTGCPMKLPRYPPNRLVVMEVARQLAHFDKIQKHKHKQGVTFPLQAGADSCNSFAVMAVAED